MNIIDKFEKEAIYTINTTINSGDIEFNAHPKFRGVSLKHLVTGNMTNNQISCHLVKVEPFCTLEIHAHEKNLEIHAVIDGEGTLYLGENTLKYNIGSIGVIPKNLSHKFVITPAVL